MLCFSSSLIDLYGFYFLFVHCSMCLRVILNNNCILYQERNRILFYMNLCFPPFFKFMMCLQNCSAASCGIFLVEIKVHVPFQYLHLNTWKHGVSYGDRVTIFCCFPLFIYFGNQFQSSCEFIYISVSVSFLIWYFEW